MDTWWKKVAYHSGLKKLIVILMLIAGFVMSVSTIGVWRIVGETNYFESHAFTNLFISKAGYLRDWIVRYDESKIFTEVTPEEITEYIKKDGRNLTVSEATEGIITDRKNYYSTIQNELGAMNKNIDYLAIDHTSGRYVTNLQIEDIDETINDLTSRSNYLIGNGYYILNFQYGSDSIEDYNIEGYIHAENYYTGEKFEGQDNYRVYLALKEELEPGDEFYAGYKAFEVNQLKQTQLSNIGIGAFIVWLILLIYWLTVVGKDEKSEEIKLNAFDYIPFEIQMIIGIISAFTSIILIDTYEWMVGVENILSYSSKGIYYSIGNAIPLFMIIVFGMGVFLLLISSLVKHFRRKSLLENIGIYKIFKSLYYNMDSKPKMLMLLGAVISINIIVDIFLINVSIVGLLAVFTWKFLCGILVIRVILDYRTILKGAQTITNGKLDKKIELKSNLSLLKDMAETINSMGTGLEKAVGESIKSERLKTELITNVSHDLKTPLTSIISYIDLLKGETIENKTAVEYIGILDERSNRLKQLVEDLVEASKAVTGNLKANPEVLRLDELVGQAMGEYSDRIEASALTLISDKIGEVSVLADGRHMWRIIENLLSNVCKYAMPQTRVYVEVYEENGYGYCTVKNISKDPLNIDPNELTQRFVRGDASRTTEGAGLGLAIAESLATIQEGQLAISIDGDLFKVTVKVPLAPKTSVTLVKDENEGVKIENK